MTHDEHVTKYLDTEFEGMAADVAVRGEPNCFLVFETTAPNLPVGTPLAVFGTKDGLYKGFAPLLDKTKKTIGVVAWWFDD